MLWGLLAAAQQLAEMQRWAEEQGILCSREGDVLWCCGTAAQQLTLAEEVAQRFYGSWQQQLLQEMAEQMFAGRPAEEQRQIAAVAAQLAAAQRGVQRELVDLQLRSWQQHKLLHLGGLVRFMLPHYGSKLRFCLYEAADLQLQQQEEQEYWALLADYLRQARGGAELHLLFGGGGYRLCVAAARGLRCLEGGRLSGYEDLLLLNLLRLAPQKLVLHGEAPPKMRAMIERVFGSRAVAAEE